MQEPYISVVVACYNKRDVIGECIRAVLNQNYRNYELIVVDDGSTDGSIEAIKKFNSSQMKVIQIEHQGVSAAKNTGIKHSKGDIVLFLDGDCVLDGEGLKELSKSFSNPKIGCVGGRLLAINGQSLIAKTIELIQNGVERKWPFGANVAYRREVLEKTGGFDERMEAGEDVDLFLRAVKLGFGYVFNPKLTAKTLNPSALTGFFRQRLRWGSGFVNLYEKHRDVLTFKVKRCFLLTAALIFPPLLMLLDWRFVWLFFVMLAVNFLRFIPLSIRLYRNNGGSVLSTFLMVPFLKIVNAIAYLLSLIYLKILEFTGKRHRLEPFTDCLEKSLGVEPRLKTQID
jgi:cellulose synthase/poly-beta-1,6-N-acetylglucosamine synthase-like glycosyltransferase